jgi:hypothetical protein
MAIVTLDSFQTAPGRLADHLAAAAEAHGHLTRLGLPTANLQPIAGSEVGVISTIISYANNAAMAAATQRIFADEAWGEFWMRVSGEAAAVHVESSIFQDLDPSWQPAADRPLGVVLAVQWRAKPGRIADFVGNVMTALPHIERLGGSPRVMQSLVGAHPMTILVSTTFADLDAYGAYSDATSTDQAWQDFWAGAMADPTADIVRSVLYMNVSQQ